MIVDDDHDDTFFFRMDKPLDKIKSGDKLILIKTRR